MRILSFLFRVLGVRPQVVPVLVERGSVRGVMSPAEVEQMRTRIVQQLTGRAEDPNVRAILELIEYRTLNAMATVQFRDLHMQDAKVVSYHAGGAAELNDLLADIVKATQGKALGAAAA